MSTVDVTTSGDDPVVLPPTVTDAIQASSAYLQMCLSVLTQTQQSGVAAAASAAMAVAAAAASQSAAQGAYKRTPVADANYTALATDIYIGYTALTAPRTVTLPALSAAVPGRNIIIGDESGNCSSTNTITAAPAGSDTIIGFSSNPAIAAPGARMNLLPTPNGWLAQ